jgi:hypothetical protein
MSVVHLYEVGKASLVFRMRTNGGRTVGENSRQFDERLLPERQHDAGDEAEQALGHSTFLRQNVKVRLHERMARPRFQKKTKITKCLGNLIYIQCSGELVRILAGKTVALLSGANTGAP